MGHTKGPWISSPHPTNFKMINIQGSTPLAAGDLPNIADLPDTLEGEANARLIAAAPEMLEALELMYHLVGEAYVNTKGEFPVDVDPMMKFAKQVIKKARGEA